MNIVNKDYSIIKLSWVTNGVTFRIISTEYGTNFKAKYAVDVVKNESTGNTKKVSREKLFNITR
jgi:hypothetical protein